MPSAYSPPRRCDSVPAVGRRREGSVRSPALLYCAARPRTARRRPVAARTDFSGAPDLRGRFRLDGMPRRTGNGHTSAAIRRTRIQCLSSGDIRQRIPRARPPRCTVRQPGNSPPFLTVCQQFTRSYRSIRRARRPFSPPFPPDSHPERCRHLVAGRRCLVCCDGCRRTHRFPHDAWHSPAR